MMRVMVARARPVCSWIDRYDSPSPRSRTTRVSFLLEVLGLPPRFPPFFRLNSTDSLLRSCIRDLSTSDKPVSNPTTRGASFPRAEVSISPSSVFTWIPCCWSSFSRLMTSTWDLPNLSNFDTTRMSPF